MIMKPEKVLCFALLLAVLALTVQQNAIVVYFCLRTTVRTKRIGTFWLRKSCTVFEYYYLRSHLLYYFRFLYHTTF